MKNTCHTTKKGFLLIPVVFLLAASTMIIGTMLNLSSQAFRTADRNKVHSEAMLIAESELDYMFYEWREARVAGTVLLDDSDQTYAYPLDQDKKVWIPGGDWTHPKREDLMEGTASVTWMTPHLPNHAERWNVLRTLEIMTFQSGQTGVRGTVNNDPGKLTQYIARVTVTSKLDSVRGNPNLITVQAGRRFSEGEVSPFQSMFSYTALLEISAASMLNIDGSISANGNVFIAADTSDGGDENYVRVKGRIAATGKVNGVDADSDDAGNPSAPGYDNYYGDATTGFADPIFNVLADGSSAASAQISKMAEPKEFTGLNPSYLARKAVDTETGVPLFTPEGKSWESLTLSEKQEAINNARHLVVDPPTGNDPKSVAPYRMYNRAGLRIKISSSGAVSAVDVDGEPIPALTAAVQSSILGMTGSDPVVNGKTYDVQTPLYDMREGKTLKVTTFDVAAFNNALASNTTLSNAYNGVVYIYDESPDGAIRLINGESVPGADTFTSTGDVDSEGTGFTVVTDKALYIQGDFNSEDLSGATGAQTGRVSIMADSVTALSGNWDDAKATQSEALKPDSLFERPALNPNNPGNPGDMPVITINAGILTGNVSSGSDPSEVNSGGAQNLVRLLEDWYGSPDGSNPAQRKVFNFKGSLGQIFHSKQFRQGNQNSPQVHYWAPDERNFTFDSALAERPPEGSPVTTSYSRGDLFTFTR